MKYFKLKKLLLLLTCINLLHADITIQDAWKNVLKINEGLKASHDEVAHSEQLQKASTSLYIPQFTLNGSYTYMEKAIGIEDEIHLPPALGGATIPLNMPLTEQDIFIANLSMLWPLYTGGKIDAANSAYKAKHKEAEAKHHMEKDKTFLKLIKVYYGVVMSKSLLKTRKEAEEGLKIHYENAIKLKKSGQIANIELLNAKVKLDSAKITTREAKHKHEITSLVLKDMIGINTNLTSNLFIDSHIKNEKSYSNEMLDNYAGLDLLKSKQSQVDSHIIIEKSAYHPTVFAFGNYMLYKDDSPMMEMTPNWIAGIGIKFDIISRHGRSEKIAAAKITKSRLNHTLNQAKNDLKLLMKKTYKEMIQYKEEYEDLGSTINLAQENLRLRKIAFKEGLSTSIEVVDAQSLLTGAKTKRLNATYKYVQKISQLAVLTGNTEKFFKLEKNAMEIK